MSMNNTIPADILKIQKKLCTFERGSRNYIKYSNILSKHIKKLNMKNRINSNIRTIEKIDTIKRIVTQ